MYHFYCLLMFAVVLFLFQFFPMSTDPKKHQNDLPTSINSFKIPNIEEAYPRHFNKLVLVVIDALRTDLVRPELMPFTSKTMKSHGCFNRITVESPTVTLPRIKALTSGHIPQYFDLIKNLAASEVLSDSWLHSAREKGLKMVFYGDNNWLTLFPHFFHRHEGTSSFDVRDFNEVDTNVTRNVNLEVVKTDWDVMILHYLGLDHIGHVHGPFHEKIPKKLWEMDKIIEKIYRNVAVDQKTMILVTGDHGMRDSGGHGGTTASEINVPLAVLGINCDNSSFAQTDIPANLAVSLGIEIPSSSIGRIQKSFLKFLTDEQYLYALNYNAQSLLNLKKLCEDDFEVASEYHQKFLMTRLENDGNLARKLYENCSKIVSESLHETSHNHQNFLLILSILAMASVISEFLSILTMSKPSDASFTSMMSKTADASWRSMSKTSDVSMSKTSDASLTPMSKTCDASWRSMSKTSDASLRFSVTLFSMFISLLVKMQTIVWICSMILLILIVKNVYKLKFVRMSSFSNLFLLGICISHPISLFSTSYIDEEHYFWYYFGTTFFLLLTIQNYRRKTKIYGLLLSLLFLRIIRELNNSESNRNYISTFLPEDGILEKILIIFGLTIIFYFLTKTTRDISLKKVVFYFVIVFLIFLLKTGSPHSILIGKLIYFLIFLEFLLSKCTLTKNVCILMGTLLLKPHNTFLIPIAISVAELFLSLKKSSSNLSIFAYVFSNYFYMAQGHRNSLASVDVSVGYVGLQEYNPLIVITQNVVHIFIFMIIFHVLTLEKIEPSLKSTFWLGLFTLKSSVMLMTCVITVINKYHLFIWSVFAPKLFIESVHLAFLFVEVSLWHFSSMLYIKS